MRDLLYLNVGARGGHPRFREVGRAAGLEPHGLDHGLGATFTDVNGDGRPDLFVANDLDPNRLYLNLPAKNGLGFRLVETRQGARRSTTRTRAWGSRRATSPATGATISS